MQTEPIAPQQEEKVEETALKPPLLERPVVRKAIIGAIIAVGIVTAAFGVVYVKSARIIDRQLAAGPFADTVNIFSAPQSVAIGEAWKPEALVARLQRNGYSQSRGNRMGWYNVQAGAVEIFPGPDSSPEQEPGVLYFQRGKIARIVSLQDNTTRKQFLIGPQFIANYSERNRERRRLARFADMPKHLVNAVLAVEDKRFFQHSGFDLLRIGKAAWVDLREGRKEQGASTLTMQLCRALWLDPEKNWSRKMREMLMTMHLEHKLTKQQIFEYYANQIYLGRRGTFNINGFGEGAHAFFGKDLKQVTVPEAALLAGVVQRPTYFNPLRYPERARERRNLVLLLMRNNGFISNEEYKQAAATPVSIAEEQKDLENTQYFVDLMNDDLAAKLDDRQKRTRHIYTTLDPDLQRAAEDAVRAGMQTVDSQLKKKKVKALPRHQPQVALVAIDPRTGEVKALVGGRNYALSQLNRAMARRQPGSVFKPFVFAAALETAVAGGQRIMTPATVVDDSPAAFQFGDQVYEPGNFHQNFMGQVTMRTALTHSLNVATVRFAEMAGYASIVSVARRAGLNESIRPTPAVALGAYETTPLEMAAAYTVFANQGQYVAPTMVSTVRAANGKVLYQHRPQPKKALDPRVAYLAVSMMQDVVNSGTGAGVRARGFALPAAGKTGTSRDGWFAGFTSELIAVVWVGFDDGRELPLEGARSALPVWTEFMKRAAKIPAYRDAKSFRAPSGIVSVDICEETGELAGSHCSEVSTDYFIAGSEPVMTCELHSTGGNRHFTMWEAGPRSSAVATSFSSR